MFRAPLPGLETGWPDPGREQHGRAHQTEDIDVRHYEGMFILHNRDLGGGPADAELDEGEERPTPPNPEELVRSLIEKVGGKLDNLLLWANRKLSYPIGGNQTGTYVLAWFTGESKVPSELDREVRINERFLRHMTLVIDALPAADALPEPLNEPTGRRSRADLDMPIETPDGEKPKKPWEMLDYKNPAILRRMISAQGKMFSRVRTGFEGKSQRRLRREVFRARTMALLPFVGR